MRSMSSTELSRVHSSWTGKCGSLLASSCQARAFDSQADRNEGECRSAPAWSVRAPQRRGRQRPGQVGTNAREGSRGAATRAGRSRWGRRDALEIFGSHLFMLHVSRDELAKPRPVVLLSAERFCPSAVCGGGRSGAMIVGDSNTPIFRRRTMPRVTPVHHRRNFV